MNSSKRAFRLSAPAAARLSFVLGLGLTGAATLAAAPALYAQQSSIRTDLAIQSDVLKALSSYPGHQRRAHHRQHPERHRYPGRHSLI